MDGGGVRKDGPVYERRCDNAENMPEYHKKDEEIQGCNDRKGQTGMDCELFAKTHDAGSKTEGGHDAYGEQGGGVKKILRRERDDSLHAGRETGGEEKKGILSIEQNGLLGGKPKSCDTL